MTEEHCEAQFAQCQLNVNFPARSQRSYVSKVNAATHDMHTAHVCTFALAINIHFVQLA